MSDLADFLLARIADDEATAREFCAVLLSRELEDGPEPFGFEAEGGPADPVRVLADCEAKRRIVDAWQADASGPLGEWDDYAWYAIEWAMKCLALPYADHPEYNEVWRP